MTTHSGHCGPHHRRGRPGGGLQRQPIIDRFRLTACERIVDLPVGGRLLGLHALPRGAELRGPNSSGQIPKGRPAAARGQQLPAARDPARLRTPHPAHRRDRRATTRNPVRNGRQLSQAVVQQWMSGLQTLAQCLRLHGEPNWPDPIISSQGRNQGPAAFQLQPSRHRPSFVAGPGHGSAMHRPDRV
jgi:hypothetical protein